ncbi:thiamine biosynthesis protein ThiI [Halorientalis persicus]|jgi:thiamine biosynthesis protein ThiI|uniref:Probable tRNA sulfurtransferase n=1 Tax=Halorientalis persicus TaxID=1367881 RepID=A0A1H8L8M4_9EURY|nr:tRNA sulfurtransferase [Halorientalis persicus]SEO01467.1 thiamine biosynthesis protein ThiI [Halorientalis persicus]
MEPPGAETVVVRYGDMSTKSSRVRRGMEERLVENIEALLADRGVDGDVERRPTRPLVWTDEPTAAAEVAADAFGVVSTSPARALPAEPEPILDAMAETAQACYDGGSFAVNARRAGDTFPMDSEDLGREGGQAIWDAVEDEFEPEVDLDDPDVTVNVEVREDAAFLYLDEIPGPGGLPLGSQRPVVALVSGGIDSPVAAYEIMRKGCPVIPVYVDLGEYGGPDHRARAVETVRTLGSYAPNFRESLRVVPGGETVELLAAELDQGRMLAFRRFCLAVAEEIALDAGAAGIVTGEAIGQKSSQTTQNLSVTDPMTDLPVFRPLLTMDKNVITERAKEIGTFTDSTIPAGCNRFAPAQAETNARLDRLRDLEPDDLRERARDAVADLELVEP